MRLASAAGYRSLDSWGSSLELILRERRLIMALQGLSRHLGAALTAVACLAVAPGVQAQNTTGDLPPLYQMAGTTCHPVRGNCVKFTPNPAAVAQPVRPTMEEQLVLQMYEEPFSASCHPAIRPCSNWHWTRLNPPAVAAK